MILMGEKMKKRLASFALSLSLLTGFILAINTKEAHAYIDFSSASFLIQMLFASLFASLFAAKLFWQRLTGGIARFLYIVKQVRRKGNI